MKKKFKPEEIVIKLREVEIEQGKGADTAAACRAVGITTATYYRWRKQYGGMQMTRLRSTKSWRGKTPD